jgi:hypothetical protein
VLELGGKSPSILLPGIDPPKIVPAVHAQYLRNAGQGFASQPHPHRAERARTSSLTHPRGIGRAIGEWVSASSWNRSRSSGRSAEMSWLPRPSAHQRGGGAMRRGTRSHERPKRLRPHRAGRPTCRC